MSSVNIGFGAGGGNVQVPATVAELYPEVDRITLYVAVEEADSESDPSYQQIIFTPETEAAFHLNCSREECVAGGFDFAPIVDKMVKSGEYRGQGALVCDGTLGPLGPRCALKAQYRVVID